MKCKRKQEQKKREKGEEKSKKKSLKRAMAKQWHQIKIFHIFVPNLVEIYQFGQK